MTDDYQPMTTRNGGTRPVPDPTELTDKAIARAVSALRDYIDGQMAVRDERLAGMDEATKLRLSSVAGVTSEIDTKVGHLRELNDEKFDSVQTQFRERDTRSERESRDNKVAVDAAFAAQKEAAAKQDEANAKAIDKSEKATAETIKTNLDLTSTQIGGLTKSVDEVKTRVTTVESKTVGAVEQRSEHTDSRVAVYTTIGLIVSLAVAGIAIIGLLLKLSGSGA